MNKLLSSIVVVASLLAGCTTPAWLGNTPASDVTLSFQADIQAPAEPYRIQMPSNYNYTRNNIDHVRVNLYRVDTSGDVQETVGGVPLSVTLPRTGLDTWMVFKGLHNNTTYKLKAYAYGSAVESSDTQISDDASCSVAVPVSLGQNVLAPKVPVVLINRLFSATATSSLNITDGQVSTEPESTDYVRTFDVRIAGTPSAFTINGVAWDTPLSSLFRPTTTASRSYLAITNSTTYPLHFVDLNHGNASLTVPAGAMDRFEVVPSLAALNVQVDVDVP